MYETARCAGETNGLSNSSNRCTSRSTPSPAAMLWHGPVIARGQADISPARATYDEVMLAAAGTTWNPKLPPPTVPWEPTIRSCQTSTATTSSIPSPPGTCSTDAENVKLPVLELNAAEATLPSPPTRYKHLSALEASASFE